MKILLSPAKSLDFKSDLPITNVTDACFLNEAKHLNSILREKSPSCKSRPKKRGYINK